MLVLLRRCWPQEKAEERKEAPLGELDGYLARCREAGAVIPAGLGPLGQDPALDPEAAVNANLEEDRQRWVERRDAYVRAGMVSDLSFTFRMFLLIM